MSLRLITLVDSACLQNEFKYFEIDANLLTEHFVEIYVGDYKFTLFLLFKLFIIQKINQYKLDQTPAPKPQHKNNDKLFATYFEFLKVLMSALRNMRANYP